MKCRHCQSILDLELIDLGSSPPSNAYLTKEKLSMPEKWFPLKVLVCRECWLVQTEDYASADELFDEDYAYFSGFSTGWLAHAKKYVDDMVARFALTEKSRVVEVAANDGYLLQYVKEKGIPCTGVEPTASTAKVAREKGIEIVEEFFGVSLARAIVAQGKKADLTAANNVLAHVPDINDFVSGFREVLKEDGVSTFEFPHLLNLIHLNQFDTIYHEHYSYLSLYAVEQIFTKNGLHIFDVEELNTHGGSLRVYAQRKDTGKRERTSAVLELLERELKSGINQQEFYEGLQAKANRIKYDLWEFLLKCNKDGKKVVGYGAAAKGNTLLNYAGIRSDLIPYVVDKNPSKQNKFLPGNRIPIVDEANLKETKPVYILILPWNIKSEVMEQLGYVKEWGCRFVVAVPEFKIL